MSATEAETETTKTFSRDEALAQIFGSKPSSGKSVLFGVPVELREPTLEQILDAQANEDKKGAAVDMLIRFVFLPSGERLFDESHRDSILGLPFGKDLQGVQNAIQDLLGIKVELKDKSPSEEEQA